MAEHFGVLERLFARFLLRFPLLKSLVKLMYSRVIFCIYRKNSDAITDRKVLRIGEEGVRSFFGYYDKSPVSSGGYILCHQTPYYTNKKPSAHHPIEIALFSASHVNRPIFKVDTRCYNWQQGARAHWLSEDCFIFNDFDDQAMQYISRMFSVTQGGEIKRFNWPVQDSFGMEYFLSLNYRRLLAMRPDYGYRNLLALNRSELNDLANDGIWRVELSSGAGRMLYSLEQIVRVDWCEDFVGSIHKVNHVMISPSGKQFIFLHRYYRGRRRFDRLMLASEDGKWIRVLSSYGMVSHCFWLNENVILGYLRGPGFKDAYWLIDLMSGEFRRLAESGLDKYGDGHPHAVGDWFVTDTYPDKARMQHLLLCNWKTGELRELGKFFHGFGFNGETRCDLHPRLSPDGKTVFFDSVFTGERQLYMAALFE